MASNYLAKGLKRSALTVALGLCFAGGVQAQSTTGGISGTVPAGSTVTISNNSGLNRTFTADASGRYNASNLPVGTYTVTSGANKREIVVTVGSNSNVSFDPTKTFDTVTVTGTNIGPLIDASAVDTRSVITAEQLQRLPLARSAESIALLAPGAVSGAAGFFGGLVSFGGSGVSENAYYVNGYFTGEPLSNLGGFSLPFGSIDQQETFIGGYSAKYGRSDGGVINQIGKRGTNEWHFGGQVTFTPKEMRGNAPDTYFPNIDFSAANANPNLPHTCGADLPIDGLGDDDADGLGDELCQYTYESATKAGKLYSRGKESTSWAKSYSLYAGGPIIKDRLFFYVAGEMTKNESVAAPNFNSGTFGPTTAPRYQRRTDTTTDTPKFYGKLDWSITDSHFLEYTYLQQKTDQSGVFTKYNFAAGSHGEQEANAAPDSFWQKNTYNILKYTGYLTDTLTLSATYGQGKLRTLAQPYLQGTMPLISSANLQNPLAPGFKPGGVSNPIAGYQGRDAVDNTKGLRADLEWVLGAHTLTAGIDNIKFEALNEGTTQFIDRYIYGRASGALVSNHVGSAVTPTNPNGYFVTKYFFNTATSMTLDQKAYYLEDRWQVTDNLLVSVGVRNDAFANANNVGAKYLDSKNQWAPRFGFAWDVFGDSSMKVFGNAGRYYLALPNSVAVRGASASTFTREYFTYSGIDANGVPTGLTPVPRTDGGTGPYSANGEYGDPVDVLSFAPTDLKNMYQDEFILGMETMLTDKWMLGAKLTHRALQSAMDDICDGGRMAAKLESITAGLSDKVEIPGCFMFNPGGTNTFSLANIDAQGNRTGSRTEVVMTKADWGTIDDMKRTYAGLDIYLEHAFDGKWEARVDYTFSKSKGNMEGQVKSEFGQADISKTQDWDAAEIMAYAYGYLANDRTHQLKVRGSYAISDEWTIAGNYRINSGSPFSCLGYFNTGNTDENSGAADPIGYGASYHTCFGEVATPGAKRNPWNRTLDLGLSYSPAYLDKKLTLGVQVRNVFNDSAILQSGVTSETAPYTVSNTYQLSQGRQTPRTVVFTASYDW